MLGPFHGRFYYQLFLIFLGQGIIVVYAKLNAELLNSLVSKNIKLLTIFVLIWILIIFIDNLIDYFAKTNNLKNLDQKIYQHLQELSLKKLFSLNVSQYIEEHSALKLTMIQKGESAVQMIIDRIVATVLPTIALVILSIGTLFIYSKIVAVMSFVIMIIIFIWAYIFNRNQYPKVIKNRDNWLEQGKIRVESFTHLPLIKTLNRGEFFIKSYLKKRFNIMEFNISVRRESINHSSKRNVITEGSSLLTLSVAAYLFIKGVFNIGIIYLIWNLTSRVYWQISSLSNVIREIPILYADAEKFLDVMDKEPIFKESGKKKFNLSGDIVFNDVSFMYPRGDKKIFTGLSLTIPKGKHTAFVGSSGSGKTTIVKLLLRNYNYQNGSITINSHELKDLDAGELREHIGYVEQHVDLLDDTVKENIFISVPERSRSKATSKLDEVARLSRINQFYDRLGEKKFDTLVGERGIKLSGGERQRIGIARAIIKDPDILIFDEATSSLDAKNEAKVIEAINDVSKNKTTVIIAHRLSTIRDADKIIVMSKGKIVGEGTHDELLTTSPEYKNLVEHQLN